MRGRKKTSWYDTNPNKILNIALLQNLVRQLEYRRSIIIYIFWEVYDW